MNRTRRKPKRKGVMTKQSKISDFMPDKEAARVYAKNSYPHLFEESFEAMKYPVDNLSCQEIASKSHEEGQRIGYAQAQDEIVELERLLNEANLNYSAIFGLDKQLRDRIAMLESVLDVAEKALEFYKQTSQDQDCCGRGFQVGEQEWVCCGSPIPKAVNALAEIKRIKESG